SSRATRHLSGGRPSRPPFRVCRDHRTLPHGLPSHPNDRDRPARHHHAGGPTSEHALMAFPIEYGASGEEVRDLHRRLAVAGFGVVNAPLHTFTDATRAALEAFQRNRGLEPTGCCDAQTWQVLVEAGYRLGDRHLYLQAPMLRGDDVAELQLRLGS